MGKEYEVIIIGGGPAGLSAGLYSSRAGLKSLLIEKGAPGGLITNAELIENFPGFPRGISGMELGQLMHQQATRHGLETLTAEATGIELDGEKKIVVTTGGKFSAKAVIIASGSERQKLGIPGEEELTGRGVSYCATCDGPFFKNRTVAVVGGGDAAITEALHLVKFASGVKLIHRRNELRATHALQEKARAEPKIEYILDTAVEGIEGRDMVKQLRLSNVVTGEKSTLDVAAVFVAVGLKPSTDYLKGVLPLDQGGYIATNEKMETAVPGIFAAGDVRLNSPRQAITAAGDGATAAVYARKFITR
jgi:thioredoxin reductase (NADPH)